MTRAFSSLVPLVLVLTLSVSGCNPDAGESDQMATDTATAVAAETTASAGTTTHTGEFLDPNTVSREELASLPGMDSTAVNAVVSGRQFDNMLAVDRALASHLTEGERDSLYTHLWIPINLNTASDQEILLIPGVGNRMLREFKEYRPYNSIERFRREIGKYVDSAEVARLERYVTIQ
jgi:DNA uptake protein ComE-like DNA-binding protein